MTWYTWDHSDACSDAADYTNIGSAQAPWAFWDSMEHGSEASDGLLSSVSSDDDHCLGFGIGGCADRGGTIANGSFPWQPLLTKPPDATGMAHVAERVAVEMLNLNVWAKAKIAPPPGLEDFVQGQPVKVPLRCQIAVACEEPAQAAWDTSPPVKTDPNQFAECKWHSSAKSNGVISANGHVFTKTKTATRGKKVITNSRGVPVELSSICMVFDSSLRWGGVHRYNYHILSGELGVADGAGFVFDKQVRRTNIQRMRCVFVNQRGRICFRNNGQVNKLHAKLPPLSVGMRLMLHVDLDRLCSQFAVFDANNSLAGVVDVSLVDILNNFAGDETLNSGFFCAVVTKDVSVGLA